MKKLIAVLLVLVMALGLVACGGSEDNTPATDDKNAASEAFKVGLVCIGDENDLGYTYNFIRGQKAATDVLKQNGIDVEWHIEWNKISGAPVADANEKLIEEGCTLIFNNSYDHEFAIADLVGENPDVQFVGMTNENFWRDDLDNTSNAFAEIYKGRYLAGVVAGCKLNELLAEGKITEPKIGYVGAFNYAEVVSGYTAYFLGVRSVCPDATMEVKFVDSWSAPDKEGEAARALIADGCNMISQHSDNTTPATEAEAAQKDGKSVFHTGYNNDMSGVAPNASLVSTRVDWTKYFVDAITKVYNGEKLDPDYTGSYANGEVVLTELNEAILAADTKTELAKAEAGLKDGSIKVFDTSKFTVNGEYMTQAFALDTDGDWVPDKYEAIVNGEYCEQYYQSAPYFAIAVDGITILE